MDCSRQPSTRSCRSADEISLLESLKRLRLAMAIVDLSLTPGGGMELIQEIWAAVPEIKLIIISVHDDPGISRAVIEAGANGFVPTRAIAIDLLSAVDAVLAGGVLCLFGTAGVKPARTIGTPGLREKTGSRL